LSKRQSPTTVLFGTTLTRTITLYELLFVLAIIKSSVSFDLWKAVKRVTSQEIREGTQGMKTFITELWVNSLCLFVTSFISWINTNCLVIIKDLDAKNEQVLKGLDTFFDVLLEAQFKSCSFVYFSYDLCCHESKSMHGALQKCNWYYWHVVNFSYLDL